MNPNDKKPAETPEKKVDPKMIEILKAEKQKKIANNQIITKDGKG